MTKRRPDWPFVVRPLLGLKPRKADERGARDVHDWKRPIADALKSVIFTIGESTTDIAATKGVGHHDVPALRQVTMRNLTAAIAMTLAICSSSVEAQTPEDQVRDAIAGMMGAAGKLDADEFMRSYWQSPALAITFDGETLRGWDAILSEQRKWWSDKNSGIKFEEVRPPEIVSQGSDVATSIQWMNVTSPENQKPSRLVITSVWRKLPEGWRVVLAHETLIP